MGNLMRLLIFGLLCWIGISFFAAFVVFLFRVFIRLMPLIITCAIIFGVLKVLADYGKQLNAKIDQKEDDD